MKNCSRCGVSKPLDQFRTQSCKKYGKQSACRECMASRCRETYMNKTRHYLWKKAKHRANKNGIEFSIEEQDVIIPDVCPILGIPLFVSTSLWSNNSPSLDRIDNTKGYVSGNIAVISFLANSFKSDHDLEEMERMSERMEYLIKYMKQEGESQ